MSVRTGLAQPRHRGLLALIVGGLLALGAFTVAQATFSPMAVELDGDTVNGAASGTDWASIFLGTSGFEATAYTYDGRYSNTDPEGDTIFDSPWSKDVWDISRWHYKIEPNTSPKTDIAHALAAYQGGADPYLYFAADRYSTNGDAKIGVWFLKSTISMSDGSIVGTHQDGDLLIESDYRNGGKNVYDIKVYQWVGDGVAGHLELAQTRGGDCRYLASNPDWDACAINNDHRIQYSSSVIPWGYVGKDKPYSSDYRAGAFIEGALKLKPFYTNPDLCFTSWIIETRSSGSSVNSILEDFVLGQFPGCSTITVDKVTEPDTATRFDFTTGGGLGTGSFSLGNGDSTTFTRVDTGTYTITEAASAGWLPSVACTGGAEVDYSADGRTATIEIPRNGKLDVHCTYTNRLAPSITIGKKSYGGTGTFGFTTTGGHGLPASFSITTGTAEVTAYSQAYLLSDVDATYTVSETLDPANWTLEELACSLNGAPLTGGIDLTGGTVTISGLEWGDAVVCTFVNAKVTTYTSRTQGFWQTHVVDTHAWWGVGAGQCLAGVTTSNSAGQDRVLGGFWASVSSKTDGKKRSASDKNRMILLQQLLAAILNNKAFGSVPTGAISITDATTTLCNPTATNRQINDAAGAMGMFNEGGDNGYYAHLSKADPALAQRLANKTYWNVVIH